MKSGLYVVLGCVMCLGALLLVPYLAMGAHDLLHPSANISKSDTALLLGFDALLFVGAIFMAYRSFRYAGSDLKK